MISKKVLAIHGRGSDINKKSRKLRKEKFKENGMELDLFQFAMLEDPSYEDWEKTFKEIDFSNYDTIYANSLGGIMTLRYMYENNLNIKRIIMTVPGISFKTLEGKKPNVDRLYKELGNPDISNVAEERIVISVKDDEVVPYQSGEEIAKMTKAEFILLEKGGHKLEGHLDLIISLVKNGMKYNDFQGEKVKFISSSEVKEGVICDVYEFEGNNKKDLGIIYVKSGYSTPKQEILKGDKTFEGLISGKGSFIFNGEENICDEQNKNIFELNIGDKMQWKASEDLVFYEICYPPYEDGRFKNLD